MAYRSRLQRIQEKKNLTWAIVMMGLSVLIIGLLVVYGVKAMATLAILIDKMKFGNTSTDVADQIPPAPPTIWADYTATNSAILNIYGISEPEARVTLIRDGERLDEQTTDRDGKVIFEDVSLNPGSNNLVTLATDNAGNLSHESKALIIVFSDKAPEVTVEKPTEGQKYSGKDNPIEVKGKTISGAKVYINGRLTMTDGEGGFVMNISLNDGENILKIRVVDAAGNETNKEVKVSYQP